MDRSYSLNSVCPNFISNLPVFEKSEFEFLRFYCTQNLYVQQTPDLLEKLAESLLYTALSLHILLKLKIKML